MRATIKSLDDLGSYDAAPERTPFREAAGLAGFDDYEQVERRYLQTT